MSFAGIPIEAVEFFERLENHNTRDWWELNKAEYGSVVKTPFELLLASLGSKYQPWRIYRPHRDTRFVADKSPYKTFIGAVTQLPGGTGFFVQISAKGLLIGSGYPMMAPDQLARFRAAIDDTRSGAQFVATVAQQRLLGVNITGGRYDPLKRTPRGYSNDHLRADWLRVKGVEIPNRVGVPKWLSTSQATSEVATIMKSGRPVNAWLDRFVGPSGLSPEEIWGR
jgi:uncharacterized protein (TIGR02453 family)